MSPEEAIARLAAGHPLRSVDSPERLGAAFFAEIARLAGSDPAAVRRLGRHTKAVARAASDPQQAYRALSVVLRLEGRWLESVAALRHASRLSPDPVEKRSLLTGAVDGLARAGKTDEALRLGRSLVRGLEGAGRPDLAARVMANMGNALLWADRAREARVWLDRAAPLLADAGLEFEAAAAQLARSTTHLFGGDPATAEATARDAYARFQALGMPRYASLCEVNVAQRHLLAGRADEAMATLRRLREQLADAPDELGRVNEFLGDAALAMNLAQEAIRFFGEALGHRNLPPLDRADCRLGRGMAWRAAGERWRAMRDLAEAARRYRVLGNVPWEGIATAEWAAATESRGRAARIDDCLARLAGKRAPFAKTTLLLAKAELDVDPGPAARRALRLARRAGLVSLEWRAHEVRARRGSASERRSRYRAMLAAILEARLLTRSSFSQNYYFQDKASAIADYLGILLESGGRRDILEARRVIASCRAVALLEEVAASARERPDTDALQALRVRLNDLVARAEHEPGVRGGITLEEAIGSARRDWMLASHEVRELIVRERPEWNADAVVFQQAGDALYALLGERVVRLAIDAPEVARRVRWTRFRWSMGNPDSGLEELARRLLDPLGLPAEGWWPIVPDGILWDLPWSALLAAVGSRAEPLIELGPFATRPVPSGWTEPRSVLVWAAHAPDLPHMERELAILRGRFPDAQICASADEAREALRAKIWDLVHVCGHGLHSAENPMFASIVFGSERIFAAEIASSPARIGVAVVSACSSGALSSERPLEPDGLARAFLARGARLVLAAGWPLDDATAARFSELWYGESGELPGRLARCRATLAAEWPDPYFWAALTAFNGYTIS